MSPTVAAAPPPDNRSSAGYCSPGSSIRKPIFTVTWKCPTCPSTMCPRTSVTSNQSRWRRVALARSTALRTACSIDSADDPTISVTRYVWSISCLQTAGGLTLPAYADERQQHPHLHVEPGGPLIDDVVDPAEQFEADRAVQLGPRHHRQGHGALVDPGRDRVGGALQLGAQGPGHRRYRPGLQLAGL